MNIMNSSKDFTNCLRGKSEEFDCCSNLAEYFETNCINNQFKKNKIAAIYNDSFLTYENLNKKANILARNILNSVKFEVKTNEIYVGILLNEGFERLYSILACLKLGLVIVPLAENRNRNHLKQIASTCHLSIVIYKSKLDIDSLMTDNNIQFISINKLLDDSELSNSSKILADENICLNSRDKTAIVLHTSGSTGTPKAIRITSSQLFNRLCWQWRYLSYKTDEIVCHRTGFMFVDNIVECLSCLLSSTTMVIVSPTEACDIVKLSETICKYKISWILTVPSLLQNWLNQLQINNDIIFSLSSISTVVSSGEILFPSLAEKYFHIFSMNPPKLVNLYGSTEVCGDVCYKIFNNISDIKQNSKNEFLSVGTPISNNQIYFESNTENEGEIIVIGKNVSPTCGLAFSTGDIGFINETNLYICGRVDDMVKINGKKFFTKEISSIVMLHPEVEMCYTIQLTINNKGYLISFFTTKNEITNKTKIKMEISHFLMNHSWSFCLPILEFIQNIPIQPQSMKPDKNALCSIASNIITGKSIKKSKSTYGKHSSTIPIEFIDLTDNFLEEIKLQKRCILEILAKHLNMFTDELTESMNFYELGGDSLTIVICVSDLNCKGFNCTTEVFFYNYIIGDIVNCILEQSSTELRDITDSEFFKYDMKNDFVVETVKYENKTEVIEFILEHFYTKELVIRYLNTPIKIFADMISEIFERDIQAGCSFCIRNSITKSIVGVQLSENSTDEIHNVGQYYQLDSENSLECFLHYCKPKISEFLKTPKLNVAIVGLSGNLKKSIIIKLLYFVEKHTIDLARSKHFKTIETVNTSEATKRICSELNYKLVKSTSMNYFLNENQCQHLRSNSVAHAFGHYMILEL